MRLDLPLLLQRVAARVSGAVGRDRGPIRRLRPVYERLLDAATGGRGFLLLLNGHERLRVDPRLRSRFPPVYEPEVSAFLRAKVRPGDTSLNVGAHVGIFAASLAMWSEPSGRVFAFEPDPRTRAVLEDLLLRNDLQGRVEVVSFAVSDTVGQATFHAAPLEGTNRLGGANPLVPAAHDSFTVRTTTIDAFVAERGLRPDWITLDIEGYEAAALRGARRTIEAGRDRLRLVVEMHPGLWASAGSSREELEGLLRELGLRASSLTGLQDPFARDGVAALSWL